MSNDVYVEFLSPVGRLVSGSLFEGKSTDFEGNPLVYKSGSNAGQPRKDFYFGLAIPKNSPDWPELWAKMYNEGRAAFPQMFDKTTGAQLRPDFAWKFIDGDSTVPNTKNKRPCDQEGYAGHYVLQLSSSRAPKVYTTGGASLLVDPNAVKRGDFIRVYGSIARGDSTAKPSIYINHNLVEFIAYGEAISSMPSGEEVFGGTPVSGLPAGASLTPPAPSASIAPPAAAPAMAPPAAAPAMAPPAAAPAMAPPAAAAPAMAPPAAAAPAMDFVNNAASAAWAQHGAPAPAPAPAAAPAPAPAAQRFYHLDGAKYTREQLVQGGWSDDQIATLPFK